MAIPNDWSRADHVNTSADAVRVIKVRDAVSPDRLIYVVPLPNGETGELHVRSVAASPILDVGVQSLSDYVRCATPGAITKPQLVLEA
jgi:hypothetical protein